MSIELRKIPSEQLVPSHQDKYIDTGILPLLDAMAWRRPLMLKGPKGSGKTMAIEQWCAAQGVPMVRQDCSEDITSKDLIGSYGLEGNDIYFGCGSLTTAIEVANEEGGCVLVLEEVNTLPSKSQKILNPLCDFRQNISVPKIGKVFKLKPGHRIWVVGTMNPNYAGTYSLNEDFRSRWGMVQVGYMSEEKERQLLLDVFSKPATAKQKDVVERLLSLAQASRTGKLGDYALSTRDLADFIPDYEALGLAKALKVLEGKYDDAEDIKDYTAQVMSLFTVNLEGVKLIDHV